LGDDAPLADGSQLGEGRLLRHRGVAVLGTKLQSLNIGAPRSLTRLALRKERVHEQAGFVVQFVDRELLEDHSFAAARSRPQKNDAPDHLWMIGGELLRGTQARAGLRRRSGERKNRSDHDLRRGGR